MRDQLLRCVILKYEGVIYILQFIPAFVGVSIHAHNNKRFKRVKDALPPGRGPVVIPCNDILDYFIISLACEREVSMIEGVDNDAQIP